MTGPLRSLRAALNAQYDREFALMQDREPWLSGYDILPPVSRWHAVHLASGTLLGPARNITGLGKMILADHQGRPWRPPSPPVSEDPHRAALEWVLGAAWDFIPLGDGCLAVRRGDGRSLTAPTWDELRDRMLGGLAAPALAARSAS